MALDYENSVNQRDCFSKYFCIGSDIRKAKNISKRIFSCLHPFILINFTVVSVNTVTLTSFFMVQFPSRKIKNKKREVFQ